LATSWRTGAPEANHAGLIDKELPDGRNVQFGSFGQLLGGEDRLFYRTRSFWRIHDLQFRGIHRILKVRDGAA